MKLSIYLFCVSVILISTGIAQEPEELKKLRFKFKVAIAEERKPLTEFEKQYRVQLQKLKERTQKAGELKKLLAVQEELKSFGGSATGFPDLERLQGIYKKEKEAIVRKSSEAEKLVIGAYQKKLSELQKRLTQEGKIEDAIKVATEIEKVSQAVVPAVSSGMSGKSPGEVYINGIKMKLCWIPAGSFQMGSPLDEMGREAGRETKMDVEISNGFWMGKHEVTQEEYETILGFNPSKFTDGGKKKPVETVNWNDAVNFSHKLTDYEIEKGTLPKGWHYTLPSEAQWEYACRAGTDTAFNNGKGITSIEGECRNLDAVGWYRGNSEGGTKPVGRKRANKWGLHDMHGNVREWCLDWFQEERMSGTKLVDPIGPESGSQRVERGGYWNWTPKGCRSAFRYGMSVGFQGSQVGFRLVLVPTISTNQ